MYYGIIVQSSIYTSTKQDMVKHKVTNVIPQVSVNIDVRFGIMFFF